MSIEIHNGSGRAKCSICKEIIIKGVLNQVIFRGYGTSERCHRSCICDYEKVLMMRELQT